MRKLFRRIHHWLNRNRLERELDYEMTAHREMMPPGRRDAFGNRRTLLLTDYGARVRHRRHHRILNPAAGHFASQTSGARERRFTLSAILRFLSRSAPRQQCLA